MLEKLQWPCFKSILINHGITYDAVMKSIGVVVGEGLGVQARTQKFWFAENLGNILDNSRKMVPDVAWLQKNCAKGLQKNTWRPFLEVTPKKVVMIFVEKICRKKLHKTLFGEVWENSGKNPSQTQKMCLLLHLWWKGTSGHVAPLLKGQRDECPRHASIFRRPCAYDSTRTLYSLL